VPDRQSQIGDGWIAKAQLATCQSMPEELPKSVGLIVGILRIADPKRTANAGGALDNGDPCGTQTRPIGCADALNRKVYKGGLAKLTSVVSLFATESPAHK
jgi:hypothetical protein